MVATRSGSLQAASRRCINSGRHSNLTGPSSQTCAQIWPKAMPRRGLNAVCVFDCLSGQLQCSCQMTIRSCAMQPLKWLGSNPEKSGESGNFWPLSSRPCDEAGTALAARVRAFAKCIPNCLTSSEESREEWKVTARSTWCSAEDPSLVILLLH